MKKDTFYLLMLLLFSISIANAQKTIVKITNVNCVPTSTFRLNREALHEGETLVLDIDYANVLADENGQFAVKLRILNNWAPFFEIPSIVVNVEPSPELHSVKALVKVPRVDLNTKIEKLRIQAYAYGNQDASGVQKGNVYQSVKGTFLLD